jgi:hypothetical protein
MRDLNILVPADCVVSNTSTENQHALEQMRKVLKADITCSTDLCLEKILKASEERHRPGPEGA